MSIDLRVPEAQVFNELESFLQHYLAHTSVSRLHFSIDSSKSIYIAVLMRQPCAVALNINT